jgi:hypothetical protein
LQRAAYDPAVVKRAGFLSGVVLLLVAPVAQARISMEIRATGALTATWHGDPARGCAEAGVCNVAGSVTLPVEQGDRSSSAEGDQGVLDLMGIGTDPATVRVVRGAPGGPDGVCLDQAGPSELTFASARPAGGRVRVQVGGFDLPIGGPLSAGRCAGPLASDLAPAFPQTSVRTSALRGRHLTLDLRGRRPFTAGAFAGEVVSTLVVRAQVTRSRDRSSRRRLPVPVRPRTPRRVALLRLRYRATPAADGLTNAFHSADTARCAILDACGLSGTIALTMTRPADLDIVASVPLARGRRATVGGVLAALRAGRGGLFVEPGEDGPHGHSVTEVTRAGARACHDERALTLPGLRGEAHGDELRLGLSDAGFSTAGDPLRSRCPGPAWSGERDRALASGTVPLAQLGARRLTVRLAGRSTHDPDFVVTPSGALTLELQRAIRSVRVVTG